MCLIFDHPVPKHSATALSIQKSLHFQVVLAQAMRPAASASLEARLAALEARMCASPQGSPEGRRMTQAVAALGCEAVRAEDLNSILARLVRAFSLCERLGEGWALILAHE